MKVVLGLKRARRKKWGDRGTGKGISIKKKLVFDTLKEKVRSMPKRSKTAPQMP